MSHCSDGQQEWCEWRWSGTRDGGDPLDMAGVMVLDVRNGRISWGRLYIEPVETVEESIDAAVRGMTGSPSTSD